MQLYGTIVVIERNGADGPKFRLRKECNLGRDLSSDIQINELVVSRNHARIYVDNFTEKVFLQALRSTNPTWLNGTEIPNNVNKELMHKDVFTIGSYHFRWEYNGERVTELENSEISRVPALPIAPEAKSQQNGARGTREQATATLSLVKKIQHDKNTKEDVMGLKKRTSLNDYLRNNPYSSSDYDCSDDDCCDDEVLSDFPRITDDCSKKEMDSDNILSRSSKSPVSPRMHRHLASRFDWMAEKQLCMDSPPTWFVDYMENYKDELVSEITTKVVQTLGVIIENKLSPNNPASSTFRTDNMTQTETVRRNKKKVDHKKVKKEAMRISLESGSEADSNKKLQDRTVMDRKNKVVKVAMRMERREKKLSVSGETVEDICFRPKKPARKEAKEKRPKKTGAAERSAAKATTFTLTAEGSPVKREKSERKERFTKTVKEKTEKRDSLIVAKPCTPPSTEGKVYPTISTKGTSSTRLSNEEKSSPTHSTDGMTSTPPSTDGKSSTDPSTEKGSAVSCFLEPTSPSQHYKLLADLSLITAAAVTSSTTDAGARLRNIYPVLQTSDSAISTNPWLKALLLLNQGGDDVSPVGGGMLTVAQAPVQEKTMSVQKETMSVQKETVSVQNEAAAVHEKTVSVQKEAAAVHEKTVSVQEKTVSVQKEAAAVQKEAASVHEKTVSVQKETATVQEKTATVQKEAAAVQEETVPVQGDTVLVQEETEKAVKFPSVQYNEEKSEIVTVFQSDSEDEEEEEEESTNKKAVLKNDPEIYESEDEEEKEDFDFVDAKEEEEEEDGMNKNTKTDYNYSPYDDEEEEEEENDDDFEAIMVEKKQDERFRNVVNRVAKHDFEELNLPPCFNLHIPFEFIEDPKDNPAQQLMVEVDLKDLVELERERDVPFEFVEKASYLEDKKSV